MRSFRLACLAALALTCGCVAVEKQSAISADELTISAQHADTAPTLDGKLDDGCWQQAQPITRFLSLKSDRPAAVASLAYVSYDRANLYIAVKFTTSDGHKPIGKMRPHDEYLFGDDIVEIMLDPGRSGTDYYQLVLNAYGATWDSARGGGGGQNDPNWNGQWRSAAHIGDGFWSAELAIPYHNLSITPDMNAIWGINICRSMKLPFSEYASTAAGGNFHVASKFSALKGIDVNFSKYLFQIDQSKVLLSQTGTQPQAAYHLPVTNSTGKARKVTIEHRGPDGVVDSQTVSLAAGQSSTLPPETLALETLLGGRTDSYIVKDAPKTRQIVISDAADGTVLTDVHLSRPWICEAMWIQVHDPWRPTTAGKRTKKVRLTIHTRFDPQLQRDGTLTIELRRRDNQQVVASEQVSQVADSIEVSIPVDELEWDAYDVHARFHDSQTTHLAATAVATVLPGGKHRIKVHNNMVSELMDAGRRGLLGSEQIEFMNPRKGWVFFSAAGTDTVSLAGEDRPLATLRAADEPTEIMRHLPAGRYTVRSNGKLQRLLIHSVPQLIYSSNWKKFKPEIMQEALQNANVLLTGNKDDPFLDEWVASGKRRIGFAGAPSHSMVDGVRVAQSHASAEDYYQQIAGHYGFAHPDISGVMVDQISAASPRQKTAIVSALARLASQPEFRGKEYSPWYEGGVVGSDVQKALLRTVVDAGWAYSFYVYLPERPTEAEAESYIQDTFVRGAATCESAYPGALKKTVVTLGYMASAPAGITQNINPGVNFRVLMQKQMAALANDPNLFGVYGVLWYYSPYVEEEDLRWAGRLFRHYGIQGKTGALTDDPYLLSHLVNPDFEEGADGWTVEAAEPNSVKADAMTGYGTLQNRYLGGTHGDTFLRTRRSDKSPNRFSQQIRNLTPGRLYTLKMITADYDDLTQQRSEEKEHAVSIKLEGVELIDGEGWNLQRPYDSRSTGGTFAFTPENPPWLSHHYYVFRPKGKTAQLTVSDWTSDDSPGGPAGQQLIYNYIEVQPYLE